MELPFIIPEYQTHPAFTSSMSILFGINKNVAELWLCNNCITFSFVPSFDNIEPPHVLIEPKVPFLHCKFIDSFRIPYSFITPNEIDAIIQQGFYLFTPLNVYYIENHKDTFQRTQALHPSLIYKANKHFVYCADHFLNGSGIYTGELVRRTQFNKAYYGIGQNNTDYHDNYGGVHLLKPVSDAVGAYTLDYERIRYLLTQHLSSTFPREFERIGENYGRGGLIKSNPTPIYSGIVAYCKLIYYIENSLFHRDFNANFLHLVHNICIHTRILHLLCHRLGFVELSVVNKLIAASEQLKIFFMRAWFRGDNLCEISNTLIEMLRKVQSLDEALCHTLIDAINNIC